MARDVNGNYALPAGNPVVSATPITSSWANTVLGDIRDALTDSASRSGKGGFTSQVKASDGSQGAPGYSFTNDLATGMFLNAVGDLRLSVSVVEVLKAIAGKAMTLVGLGTDIGDTDNGLVIDTFSAITNATHTLLNVLNQGVQKAAIFSNGAARFLGPVEVGTPTASGHALRKDSTLTRSNLPAVGQGIALGSGSLYAVQASLTDVTNCSVALTTTGRPVLLVVQPKSGFMSFQLDVAGTIDLTLDRDGGTIATWELHPTIAGGATGNIAFTGSLVFLDDQAGAGAHTYKLRASGSGSVKFINYATLVAFEL